MTNRQTVNIVDHEVGALDIASERKLILESVTSQGSSTNITCANHGLRDGDAILIQDIAYGMIELNDREFLVMFTTSNSFQLHEMDGTPVNSSGYGQYENGAGGLVDEILDAFG